MRTQHRLEAQAKRYTQQHFDQNDSLLALIEQTRKSEGCTRCGGNHPLEDCHFPTVRDRLTVQVYPIPR